MLGPKGYLAHHHFSTFVGTAPVTHPALVVAVVIRDPQGKHYHGGYVSGPIFAQIMEPSLRLLNVQPDGLSG